jgi:rhodanese-related sulfurtransferase
MRAGTESLHNIAGFGAACRDAAKLLAHAEPLRAMKRQLTQGLKEIKPDLVVNSPETDGLPNTLSITFPNVNNAELLAALDQRGIAVSAGSACSAHDDRPSSTLKAIGLSDQAARATIRVSLGCDTSARDIRYTLKVFRDHFAGRTLLVSMIEPGQLNEALLFNENTYVLDVRSQSLRKKCKSLPNAHEASFAALEKYLRQIPKEKHIVVACKGGGLSYIAAYYLRSKGFERVSNLRGGVSGWKKRHGDLYQKYAGQNVTVLRPAK